MKQRIPLIVAFFALGIAALALLRSPLPVGAVAVPVGVARAGIYGNCDTSGGTLVIFWSFNSVNSKPITISEGPGNKSCTVTFPFKVWKRVIAATASSDYGLTIAATYGGPQKRKEVTVYIRNVEGNEDGGRFFLVVY